jgi:hypothetical protein
VLRGLWLTRNDFVFNKHVCENSAEKNIKSDSGMGAYFQGIEVGDEKMVIFL